MFKEVPSSFDFPKMEKEIRAFWEANKIYEQSLRQREGGKPFVFFEGPPTANGLPHPGHCLTRAIKDLFPRYKTMTGHHCLRKGGWDTHGLPVEVEVCKELGIHTKEEIETYGIEAFNRKCLESVFRYTQQWEDLTRRLGFWVNLDEAYVTYHQSYVESVWWSLKTLFDAGLLYQGHKIVWWWAQGGTALSAGEVGQGYREVDDPSVYVRFPLVPNVETSKRRNVEIEKALAGGKPVSLLVWTTTPWTLPSNTFAAVHKDFDYAIVHDEETGERLIFAAALVEAIGKKAKKKSWTVEATVKGADLVGLSYRPPFDDYRRRPAKDFVPHAEAGIPLGDYAPELVTDGTEFACWRILHADFVTLDSGTGLVHEAPAFGEVDYDLLQEERKRFKSPESIPLLCAVAPNGKFTEDAPTYKGRWVKECDKDIVRELKERTVAGSKIPILMHQEQYRHDYPFCWRADQDPLIQYPRKSWFIRTTQYKDAMLENNQHINWLPDHIKSGRFGKFLESNVDWSLSRERYWGTPLPIWVCEKTGHMEAIGSYDELLGKPGVQGLDDWENAKKQDPGLSEHLKVHKPYIDAITYQSPKDANSRMRRVTEVIDCWYDSGAMPFAQWGWPHKGGEMMARQFPADFISEALDQTRGWFYSLTAISTMLFGKDGVAQGSMGLRPVRDESGHGVASAPVTGALHMRKRILPHWESGGSTYFLTFRCHSGQVSEAEREIVLSACRHWDGARMRVHAVVVMPDHVHMLITPLEKSPGQWWSLAELMHSIKGFSANEINRQRGVTGPFWQQETFDRIIRNEDDYREKLNYIVTNPSKRGLGDDYQWTWIENEFDAHGPEAHATLANRTHIDYPVPFRNCIVLGLLMGEDGLKMSKSKKNYKEPTYIFEHEGADAMRWLFFSGQTPWTSIRFQEAAIAEGQREFLIRLYNCYSFFVIYASIDKWTPDQSRDSVGAVTPRSQGPSHSQGDPSLTVGALNKAGALNQLDKWILSALDACSVRVFDCMEAYDNFNAARALVEFVDALSNWYVRRSRERFWRSGMDEDKRSAYATLYHCLVETAKLIAPFTPFIAEAMYQNLVVEGAKGTNSGMPSSVHLCDYPVTAETRSRVEARIDTTLNEEIELVRQVVSCGRAARAATKLRVRQPLPKVELFHRRADLIRKHEALIKDELNVKQIDFVSAASIDQYVHYEIKPDFKKIGPKFGPLAPKIKAALGAHPNVDAIVKQLEQTGACTLTVDGQEAELSTDELLVELHAREGWAAERIPGQGILVLDTHLTDALRDEGVARDFVNVIQQTRKNLNLQYEQRIDLAIVGGPEVQRIVNGFAAYIRGETLAQNLLSTPMPDVAPAMAESEGLTAEISVRPV